MGPRRVNQEGQEVDGDDVITMVNGQKIVAPEGDATPGPGRRVNWFTPQRDVDGTIPEFVNISGKKLIIKSPENPNVKTVIKPWGILQGAQYRHTYVEDYPGRKRSPRFIERRRKDGKLDQKFLLDVDQVVAQVRKWRGGKLRIDMNKTIKNIIGLRDNGAFKPGSPRHLDARVRDDRPEVIQAVMDQRQYVEMRLELFNLLNGSEIDDEKKKYLIESLAEMRKRLYPGDGAANQAG